MGTTIPHIFDNIEQELLQALQQTLEIADHADFCVGYFNLRGWKRLDHFVERWSGSEGHCCRLLVGMPRPPAEELRAAMGLAYRDGEIDNQTALHLKKRVAGEFREHLTVGTPTNVDEACLRRQAHQIKNKKVVAKPFLRHPLHAKLYLSDCFHLSDGLVRAFPVPNSLIGDTKLMELGGGLMEALRTGAERKTIQTKAGDKIPTTNSTAGKRNPSSTELIPCSPSTMASRTMNSTSSSTTTSSTGWARMVKEMPTNELKAESSTGRPAVGPRRDT
jgi:hypothetical protein